LAPTVYPTGCCIHALTTMMKKPDSHDPAQTSTADAT
jgi:hypothetical protein